MAQFHGAAETSENLQSWQKGKQTCPSSHGGRKEKNESKEGDEPLIKPSCQNSLSPEQHEGNHPHDSVTSHWFPPTTLGDYGNYNSDEILVGTQANYISIVIFVSLGIYVFLIQL